MMKTSRRRFLISGVVLGGAAYFGYRFLNKRDRLAKPASFKLNDKELALNGWFKITADNTVMVMVPRQEMGQGIYTALAMLVAEELDADWSKVRVEQAPIDKMYANITMLTDGPYVRRRRQELRGKCSASRRLQPGRHLGCASHRR